MPNRVPYPRGLDPQARAGDRRQDQVGPAVLRAGAGQGAAPDCEPSPGLAFDPHPDDPARVCLPSCPRVPQHPCGQSDCRGPQLPAHSFVARTRAGPGRGPALGRPDGWPIRQRTGWGRASRTAAPADRLSPPPRVQKQGSGWFVAGEGLKAAGRAGRQCQGPHRPQHLPQLQVSPSCRRWGHVTQGETLSLCRGGHLPHPCMGSPLLVGEDDGGSLPEDRRQDELTVPW